MEITNKLKRYDQKSFFMKEYGTQVSTLLALFGLIFVLSIMSENFLTVDNLLTVLLQASINSVIAVGMTFVIISGGIDLSVGSIVALCTAVMGELAVNRGIDPIMSMAIALGIGLTVGFIHGMIIGSIDIPPFIVTLGGMTIWRGLALEFVKGKNIYGLPSQVTWLGSKYLGIFPIAILAALLLYVVGWYILKKTRIGLYTYSIGGNEEASKLSGINIRKTKVFIYAFTGLLCGVAGIMIAGRMNGTSAIVGQGYELDAIAAVAIGGTCMSGGKGNIWGTLLGAVVMGVIRNGLNLLSVSPYFQMIIIGLVIVTAVAVDALRNKK